MDGSQELTSRVFYDVNLVDNCFYNITSGCARTIAFWFYAPQYISVPFSTADPSYRTRSGVNIAGLGTTMGAFLSFDSVFYRAASLPIVISEWHHIVVAYHRTGETADFALYVNFSSENPVAPARNGTQEEVVPERFMGSGSEQRYFGILDELLIFPEFLSPSQIAQLNQTYPEKDASTSPVAILLTLDNHGIWVQFQKRQVQRFFYPIELYLWENGMMPRK